MPPLDADRYERLITQFGAAITRLASVYERNAANRDDLVQEIALALWKALPAFRGQCSERTYVFRIAHNRGLSHQWRRQAIHADLQEAERVPDPRASPEIDVGSHQRRDRLVRAIRGLPIAHRQVMILALEGLSHAEIAEVLGISENNVAVRASRGRKELRAVLEGSV